MGQHIAVIPFLQKECRLFSSIPLPLSDKINVRSIQSEHIGAIIKRRRELAEFISGKTKCIVVDSGAVPATNEDLQNIALMSSFVLNVFAKVGAAMCTQAFKMKYNRSHTVTDLCEIASIGPPNYDKYEVDEGTSPQAIKTLYNSIDKAIFKEKSLGISLKRFNGSLTKTSMDDKLIDMCICLESIFNVQNEISFRFSIYNAVLAENEPEKRYEAFLMLKKFYGQRSNIVRGNKNIDPDWVSENWNRIVRVAKVALIKKIEFLQDNASRDWQAYFDKMALGVQYQ